MIAPAGGDWAAYGLCAAMLAFAGVLRLRCGAWSNPSVVFALFWGGMTLLPVYFVPELQPSVPAIAYIATAVLALGLPVFLLDWRGALAAVKGRDTPHGGFLAGNEAVILLVALQATVLGFMAANVAYQGFSVRDLLLDPFRIGCEYLGYRYRGDVKAFLPAQAGTILNYVAAALGGFIVAQRRSFLLGATVMLCCLLPSVYSIAVYADKGTIFLTLAFFYGAVVAGRIRNGNTALVTWRALVAAPLVVVVVAAAIGLAMMNRTAESCEDRQTAAVTTELADAVDGADAEGGGLRFFVRSYAFGHLFAFSSWFDHYLAGASSLPEHTTATPEFVPQFNTSQEDSLFRNPDRPTYGFWTFMSVAKHLDADHFATLPPGYFEEYYLRPGILQTNIYTFFRGLIYDFTLPGSFAFLAIFGLLMNLAYRRLLLRAHAPVAQSAYVFFAGYLYTSYIISLLIWNSVIASGLATFVMLAVIGFVDRRGGSVGSVLGLWSAGPGKDGGAR